MLGIIHILIGGIIGEEFNSIILIILASFLMHFIIDMLPHWDGGFDRKYFHDFGEFKMNKILFIYYTLDFLIALVAIFGLYHVYHSKTMMIGAFAGIFPDLINLGYKTRLKNNKHYMKVLRFHSKIQGETSWRISTIFQFSIVIFLIILLILF